MPELPRSLEIVCATAACSANIPLVLRSEFLLFELALEFGPLSEIDLLRLEVEERQLLVRVLERLVELPRELQCVPDEVDFLLALLLVRAQKIVQNQPLVE